MFLLGTENAVGGHGSLAVYAILFYHCFIVLFQFFDIIFTLKLKKKKNVKSGLGPKPPSPMWTKSIQMFFFFFFTSLTVWGQYSTV